MGEQKILIENGRIHRQNYLEALLNLGELTTNPGAQQRNIGVITYTHREQGEQTQATEILQVTPREFKKMPIYETAKERIHVEYIIHPTEEQTTQWREWSEYQHGLEQP